MGRHKDVVCPRCGYSYRVGASEEVDPETEAPRGARYRVTACTCPMCRYTADLDRDFDLAAYPHRHQPSYAYNGDRLLVDKLAYEFHRAEAVGRGGVPLSERRLEELYQTAGGLAGRHH